MPLFQDLLLKAKKTFSPEAPFFPAWSFFEKVAFRIAFVFYFLLIIPLDVSWYIGWFHSKTLYYFLFYITWIRGLKFDFKFLDPIDIRFGLSGYADIFVTFLIAVLVGILWTIISNKTRPANYGRLRYWLRVTIRYRLAIAILAFGFLKVFPHQMPEPSISNLNTNFGDFDSYKIYWQQVGIVIWYEVVLGFFEVIGGLLLFFRRTAGLGSFLLCFVLFNIVFGNFAYDGTVHLLSSYQLLLALYIFAPYAGYLWKIFIKKEKISLQSYYPFINDKKRYLRLIYAKNVLIISITVIYVILKFNMDYGKGLQKYPNAPGLTDARGYYNVTYFALNGKELPYTPFDSVRWQHVAFEKWNTIVFQVFKPFPISLPNGHDAVEDSAKTYEFAGVAGGNDFYRYKADTVNNILRLTKAVEHKFLYWGGEGPGNREKHPETKSEIWHFIRPTKDRIVFSGRNYNNDSVYAVLDRVPLNYPVFAKK